VLNAVSNRVIGAGLTLSITNTASDPDQPWQTLTFALLNAPGGAVLATNTGVLTWRPGVAQANTTNLVSLKVSDNGTPSLSATQSFLVTVVPITAPLLGASAAGGQLTLHVNGDFGPDYAIESSTNLLDWALAFSTNSPALPFDWLEPNSLSLPSQFYRIRLGP